MGAAFNSSIRVASRQAGTGLRRAVLADFGRRYSRSVETRDELHRKVDALSEAQLERARLVVVDEVDGETSVDSILARHGERRLESEELVEHFGDLPRDGEG